MTRYTIDCRQSPAGGDCTFSGAADSEEELLRTMRMHGAAVHDMPDNDETLTALKGLIATA